MTWKESAVDEVRRIMDGDVDVKDFHGVPHVNQVGHGIQAKRFQACVLAIDLRGSTAILDDHRRPTAVKLFKAFHEVACRAVEHHGGRVRSFDGDGILALWHAPTRERIQEATAAAIGMKDLLRGQAGAAMRKYREIDFGIGLDWGEVHASRVGPGSNSSNVDLVWLGHPVTFAVALANRAKSPSSVWVSDTIHTNLEEGWRVDRPEWFILRGSKWQEEEVRYQGGYYQIHRLPDRYQLTETE